MTPAATQITNLLYSYAEHIDAGNLSKASALFSRATFERKDESGQSQTFTADQMLDYWSRSIVLYEDGTPRTRHAIINPIIKIDDLGESASCRSLYLVLQQSQPGQPIVPVLSGGYFDRFSHTDDTWYFTHREFSSRRIVGDISHHLL